MLLSEMFGVERDTDFMIKWRSGTFKIKSNICGAEYLSVKRCDNTYAPVNDPNDIYKIIAAAPRYIIHLPPPLTDEQREQLKAIWTLGGRWLAEDEEGDVFAYDSKPHKIVNYCRWNNDEDGECFTVIRDLSVCSLVSWSDPEPYDIGKALEVEG